MSVEHKLKWPQILTLNPIHPTGACVRHSFTAYAQGFDVIHLCLRSLECHHQRSIQTSSFCSLLIHSNNRRTNFFSFPFYDNDSIAKIAIKLELPLRHRRSCTDRAGYCHGLLCIANNNKKDVALWNPFIQRFKRISFSLSEIMESEVARLGFGYDSATDDYKVVRIMEFRTSNGFCSSEVKVYGLKSNSWKRVQNLPSNHRYFGSYIHCLNSAVHWLTNPDLGNTFIILTLDLVSEKYHEFPTPEDVMHAFPLPGLTVLGGCLCFIVNNKAESHVWAMKEY